MDQVIFLWLDINALGSCQHLEEVKTLEAYFTSWHSFLFPLINMTAHSVWHFLSFPSFAIDALHLL